MESRPINVMEMNIYQKVKTCRIIRGFNASPDKLVAKYTSEKDVLLYWNPTDTLKYHTPTSSNY